MDRKRQEVWLAYGAAVFALPVVYVASFFAIAKIAQETDSDPPGWVVSLYLPLLYAANEWEWLGRVMRWIWERLELF